MLAAFRRHEPVFPLLLYRRALLAWCGGVLLLAGLAATVAWLLSARPWDRSLARLLDAGTIRVGYAIEPPYAFLRPDGQVSGQSPVLARRIVQRLGIRQVEWRVAEFGALITELLEGRIDVIAAGMYITAQRAARVQFSEPIFRVRQALLVAAGNPKKLHAYSDALARPDVKLAALSGAVEADLLRTLGLPASQLVLMPDALTGRAAVAAGLVDGLALTSPAIDWMVRHDRSGRLERAIPFAQELPEAYRKIGFGAFAFRTQDRALLEAWNQAQRLELGSKEYLTLIQEFGFTDQEQPGTVQTREILAQ